MATKSDNTQGNPWHDEANGKFTSPNTAGEKSFNAEYTNQNTNINNPKYHRMRKYFKNKTPYKKILEINKNDAKAIPDELIFSPIFYNEFAPQIAQEIPGLTNTCLSVHQYADDAICGNDFFFFEDGSGEKIGVDLKNFSYQDQTIKIQLMKTISGGKYVEGYYLKKTTTNKFYAFQGLRYKGDEQGEIKNIQRNTENILNGFYNEEDVTQRVENGMCILVSKDDLHNYFSDHGLEEDKIIEMSNPNQEGTMMNILENLSDYDIKDQNSEFNAIYNAEQLGYKYKYDRKSKQHILAKDYGDFLVVGTYYKDQYGKPIRDLQINIEPSQIDDMDTSLYYEFKKV